MNLDFKQMKPILQAEYDRIMDTYPTDMSLIDQRILRGVNGYLRQLSIMEAAAELCPVHLIRYYPFACELDVGEPRGYVWQGLGQRCLQYSGVDFSGLHEFNARIREEHIASFNHFTDFYHGTMDHDLLLEVGFSGVWERCRQLNETETDPAKRIWREHVMAACKTVERIGLRFRQAAVEALAAETDPLQQQILRRIIQGANVPWEKPETFFDALTAILRATVIITCLEGMEMTCYGQLDRLVWPYYQRDLENGTLTREEAAYLISAFLHRSDFHAHYNSERTMYDSSMTVMVGGCDRDGNPLTYIDVICTEDDSDEVLDRIMQSKKAVRLVNTVLDERERKIIIMRYGLNGKKPLAQREVAVKLNISRSYVSRLEKSALQKLKEKME